MNINSCGQIDRSVSLMYIYKHSFKIGFNFTKIQGVRYEKHLAVFSLFLQEKCGVLRFFFF